MYILLLFLLVFTLFFVSLPITYYFSMKKILVIYTGGTIGMVKDKETGALYPFDMEKIYEALPVLKELDCVIDTIQFNPIIDSSDMRSDVWIRLAGLIKTKYAEYDGYGMVKVSKADKWGLIDMTGQIIVETKFDYDKNELQEIL